MLLIQQGAKVPPICIDIYGPWCLDALGLQDHGLTAEHFILCDGKSAQAQRECPLEGVSSSHGSFAKLSTWTRVE